MMEGCDPVIAQPVIAAFAAEHAGNTGRVDGDFGVMGIESISLSRGMCFGPCPVYQVTIQADGEARWRGEDFTERIGRFRGKVEPEDFRKIAVYVERCGFFEWADEYRPSDFVTDNPEYLIQGRRVWISFSPHDSLRNLVNPSRQPPESRRLVRRVLKDLLVLTIRHDADP